MDDTKKAYFDPVIKGVESDAKDLGLSENGKYALAWIKLWVENYTEETDDGPICNTLVHLQKISQDYWFIQNFVL